MKRIKFTKTNLEKIPHPTGKTPVRYFATNCSHLWIRVQPQPSLVKSYYAQWSKIIEPLIEADILVLHCSKLTKKERLQVKKGGNI